MLNLFLYLIVFFLGLASGSFLNSIIYRLDTGESFLLKRSHCPHCRHQLSWLDLIPVLSFLILKGKCRYCQSSISWQYPLIELVTGILFFSIFYFFYPQLLVIGYHLLISCLLIIIFVYDLKHYIIPDKVIYPAIGIAFIFNALNSYLINHKSFLNPLLTGLGASAFFLLIVLVSQGKWMGPGDVKLAALVGFFLGWPNILVTLFLAFFIGALIGVGLVISGKKTLKSEVPFGTFLVTGTFIALFWSKEIINWYLNLFI